MPQLSMDISDTMVNTPETLETNLDTSSRFEPRWPHNVESKLPLLPSTCFDGLTTHYYLLFCATDGGAAPPSLVTHVLPDR